MVHKFLIGCSLFTNGLLISLVRRYIISTVSWVLPGITKIHGAGNALGNQNP